MGWLSLSGNKVVWIKLKCVVLCCVEIGGVWCVVMCWRSGERNYCVVQSCVMSCVDMK